MESNRKGWYEREEIQKVTKDWVRQNCRLTGRERELLQIIYDRKLVKRDHLEIISESYRKAGDNRTRLINRAIKKMFRQMVLDKVHEVQEIGKGNTPCIVAIDKGGSIILGVPHKIRIPHRTTKIKQTSYVTRICPSNYKHINGVNQCEVDTILFCEATNNELLKWELEVNITFYYSMEKTILIPDVFVECKFKNINWLAFLEYDTGSENHRNKDDFPVIREKLDKYRKYKLSEIWRDKYKRFPMILLVTEDEKRVQWFTNRCRELGLEGFGVYYKQYVKVLETLSRMSK